MASREHSTTTEDHALVLRMGAGDDRALGELYDRYSAVAYGLACTMVKNVEDAEEVVADAFAQVWRSAGQFDAARGNVASWIVTITRTRALDLLRSRRRRTNLLDRAAAMDSDGFALPPSSTEEAPDIGAERTQTRQMIAQSLAELPEPQRRVIEMAYFAGLSQSEIATQLDQPLGTIKTRMRAAMHKLRQALEPLFSEVGQ